MRHGHWCEFCGDKLDIDNCSDKNPTTCCITCEEPKEETEEE